MKPTMTGHISVMTGILQTMVVLVTMAGIFVFGYFVMKKVGRFLEQSYHAPERLSRSGGGKLRLGFSNELSKDSIEDVLHRYSKMYPDVSLLIFKGSEQELLKELSDQEIDMVFLPESEDVLEKRPYHVKRILLNHTLFGFRGIGNNRIISQSMGHRD